MRKWLKKIKSEKLVVGSAINFMIRTSGFIVNFIVNICIANIFGVDNFGLYSLNLTFINLTAILLLMGTDTFYLRESAKYFGKDKGGYLRAIYGSIIRIIVVMAIILVLFLIILYQFNPIKNYLLDNRVHWLILLSGIFLAINKLNLSNLRGNQKILLYSIGDKLSQRLIIFILLGVAMLLIPMNVIILMSVSFILNALIFVYLNRKVIGDKNQNRISMKETVNIKYKSIIKESYPMFFSSSILMLLGWIDTFMISIFLNSTALGLYSAVLQISFVVSFAMTAINSIAAPMYATFYWNNEVNKLKENLYKALILMFWSSLVITLFVFFFSDELIGLFGIKEPKVKWVLVILLLGQVLSSSMGSVVNLLNMTNGQNIVKNAMLIGLVSNIALNLLLIPYYGILGVAIATAFSFFIKDLICTIYARKKLGFPTSYIGLQWYRIKK